MPEKAAPASAALTVSDRTRTPTRNICSLPITRTRSITSSRGALRAIAAATWDSISSLGGMRAKKPGSRTASRTLGRCDSSLGEPRRRAKDRRDQIQKLWIGLEQREQLDARRQAGQKPVEGDEGEIGIAALGERRQKRRHQLGEALAGPRRAGCGIAAEMPAAHRRRELAWLAEAHRRQGLDGLGIIAGAGEDEAAGLGREPARLLEERRIMIAAPSRRSI